MHFDAENGKLLGAEIDTYLLEKARLASQAAGERNYHIFYELIEYASASQLSKWGLPKGPEYASYTRQGDTYERDDVQDMDQYKCTLEAFSKLGFSSKAIEDVLQVVAGVLHLGDIRFSSDGGEGSKVSTPDPLKAVQHLLIGGKGGDFEKVLTTRTINVNVGEVRMGEIVWNMRKSVFWG